MKIHRLLPGLALFLPALLHSAEDPAAKPAPAPPADFSTFKTADELWTHLQKLQEQPKQQPKSRDEALEMAREWLGKQQQAAEAFARTFPQDPRRWPATLIGLRAAGQMRRFSGQTAAVEGERQKLVEIINAPDAPPAIKGEAAFLVAMMLTGALDKDKPATFSAFHQTAAEFLEKYPEHPLAEQMKQVQLRVLNDDPSAEGEAILKRLAAGADPRAAEAAKATLERHQKAADLKSKPVDIQFTATDGKGVDLAKLRGKVVLVDFWASWCGPCIAEMPNVVSAYKKLHDKGFEIIGISLDQDKAAMEGALKKNEMTWKQYFDGTGWENKFSKAFGITSIPATWLIDKKGMLRETGLRGEALALGVEKLLAE